MLPTLKASKKEDVIDELCSGLTEHGFFDDKDRLVDEALTREAILSTAVGPWFSFPSRSWRGRRWAYAGFSY